MTTQIENFDAIYQRACERKGGAAQLESLLGAPLDTQQLQALGDDRYLAEFSKKVFQAGFVWRVVEDKWPAFEDVFFGFVIDKILLMPDEMLERKASDKRIIRNYNKVKTIRDNALMIREVQREHGSFARFVAHWPEDDIVGLWAYLKQHGARLGGNTAAYGLRALGKDTFLLSRDVVGYFQQRQLIEGGTTSKRSLQAFQQGFNQLRQESGRSLQQLSQIISLSVGDNHRHAE